MATPVYMRTGLAAFEQSFDAKRPQCLFTVEIASGKTNIFYRYDGWLGHIQFSPTDPSDRSDQALCAYRFDTEYGPGHAAHGRERKAVSGKR